MANDYKKDTGKPPVLDALTPFYPALEALARLMVDSAVHHKLQGAKDPFNEWRQLPQAKTRLANAAARHLLKGPWRKDPDSGHAHAAHALFDILASLTIHEEDNAETCCGAPDSAPDRQEASVQLRGCDDSQEWEAKAAEASGAPARIAADMAHVLGRATAELHGTPYALMSSGAGAPPPAAINGPAGADWREAAAGVPGACRHPEELVTEDFRGAPGGGTWYYTCECGHRWSCP